MSDVDLSNNNDESLTIDPAGTEVIHLLTSYAHVYIKDQIVRHIVKKQRRQLRPAKGKRLQSITLRIPRSLAFVLFMWLRYTGMMVLGLTNMSVLLIVGPKCMLAATLEAPW